MPSLEITTMIGCPLRCTFCPQDKLAANYPAGDVRALTLESFRTILSKVPPYVRIDFSGMSEPWANRATTDMLAYALGRGFNVAIYTTLQGMRDPERVVNLIHGYAHKVEAVVVHLPDARGNMPGFKAGERYDQALAAFSTLVPVLGERFQSMTMDEDNRTQGLGPTTMLWSALSRAGNLDREQLHGQAIEDEPLHTTPLTCSFTPFYDQNVLLPNGDVMLCCMDYSVKHRLGNLLEQDYSELFSGPAMGRLIAENMKYGGDSICRKCSRARTHDLGDTKHFWTWSC